MFVLQDMVIEVAVVACGAGRRPAVRFRARDDLSRVARTASRARSPGHACAGGSGATTRPRVRPSRRTAAIPVVAAPVAEAPVRAARDQQSRTQGRSRQGVGRRPGPPARPQPSLRRREDLDVARRGLDRIRLGDRAGEPHGDPLRPPRGRPRSARVLPSPADDQTVVSAVTRTQARSTELVASGSATTRMVAVSASSPGVRSRTTPVMSAGPDGGAEGDGEAG